MVEASWHRRALHRPKTLARDASRSVDERCNYFKTWKNIDVNTYQNAGCPDPSHAAPRSAALAAAPVPRRSVCSNPTRTRPTGPAAIRERDGAAAILAADVVGYSRLMGTDEAGTLAALKRHTRQSAPITAVL